MKEWLLDALVWTITGTEASHQLSEQLAAYQELLWCDYCLSVILSLSRSLALLLSFSDGSQDAFDLYYSETYSESSSISLQDSHRSLASVSDAGDSNPGLLLMQEYMITVSVCSDDCSTLTHSRWNWLFIVEKIYIVWIWLALHRTTPYKLIKLLNVKSEYCNKIIVFAQVKQILLFIHGCAAYRQDSVWISFLYIITVCKQISDRSFSEQWN